MPACFHPSKLLPTYRPFCHAPGEPPAATTCKPGIRQDLAGARPGPGIFIFFALDFYFYFVLYLFVFLLLSVSLSFFFSLSQEERKEQLRTTNFFGLSCC